MSSFLGFGYTIAFVWLVVGSVWFFAAANATGSCQTLRRFGIGSVCLATIASPLTAH